MAQDMKMRQQQTAICDSTSLLLMQIKELKMTMIGTA